MLCNEMSAPGRQLPVGQIYAARSRETGTAQTGATQICSFHLPPLLHARARGSLAVPRCAVNRTHTQLSEIQACGTNIIIKH